MNILLLCSRFQTTGTDPWLFDELAHALRKEGVNVWVVVNSVEVARRRGYTNPVPGLHVLSVGTERPPRTRVGRILRRLTGIFRIRRQVRTLRRAVQFDAVLWPTISMLYGGAARLLPETTRRFHILWDFFPVHHATIGSMPSYSWLHVTFRAIERWSMSEPDIVFTMSRAGARFFSAYHPGTARAFRIMPPWAADSDARTAPPTDGPLRVVFGGQLVSGRGVDTLIEASARMANEGFQMELLIAGAGKDQGELQEQADRLNLSNVRFLGQLDRTSYSTLLTTCHVGVAITQRDVASPSFPSKIGDYARVGLPILVATEEGSDVGEFIKGSGAGLSAEPATVDGVVSALKQFSTIRASGELQDMSVASRLFYEQYMTAESAAALIVKSAANVPEQRQSTYEEH